MRCDTAFAALRESRGTIRSKSLSRARASAIGRGTLDIAAAFWIPRRGADRFFALDCALLAFSPDAIGFDAVRVRDLSNLFVAGFFLAMIRSKMILSLQYIDT
jgi:hypothetical protein